MTQPRKVVIARPGSYDKLTIQPIQPPAPGPGEVRIAARAIGVNYADCMVRMGLYSSAKEFVGWPITPGFEVAGVVDALGEGVDDLAIGDEVFGVTLFGGYSTHVVTGRRYVFQKPEKWGFSQVAGMPAVYMTAWFALFELAHPRPGAKVLVHSAAGGVGGCLVQLAKLAGCHVTGVVGGTHKVQTVRDHGADEVIDKSKEPLWARAEQISPDGFDVILDANGVATLGDSKKHLRRAGKLVVYGFHTMIPRKGGRPNWLKLVVDFLRTPRFNPLELTTSSHSVMAFNLSYLFDRADLLQLALTDVLGWLAEGTITPPGVTEFALDDVGKAHAAIESGTTTGKLILVP